MGIKFSKLDPDKDEVPTKGLMFLMVLFVSSMNNTIDQEIGTNNRKIYSPYFIAITSYLLLANISSIFGLTPPLSNIALALSMSAIAFIVLQFTGFKYQGFVGRLKGWMGPVKAVSFLIFPISVFGEFTTPFSMGMRLFGNIFSGVVLAGFLTTCCQLLGGLLGDSLAVLGTTILIHPVFDIFFGAIQMYIYFMLTLKNVRLSIE